MDITRNDLHMLGVAPTVYEHPFGRVYVWKVPNAVADHLPHMLELNDGRILVPTTLNIGAQRGLWFYPDHAVSVIELPSIEAAITTMLLIN